MEKVFDSEKHYIVTSHELRVKNDLRVSYAQIFKQLRWILQSCDNCDSQVVAECDLTQCDQFVLEALQSLHGPFKYEVLCSGDRVTGSFVSDHVFNLNKKELSAKKIFVRVRVRVKRVMVCAYSLSYQ